MTWALCLHCGEIKFGAIAACPGCDRSSTGDPRVDIAFSEHRIGLGSLKSLGSLIKRIHDVSEDDAFCTSAFLWYVAENYPDVLDASFPSDVGDRAAELLHRIEIPTITIESPEEAQLGENSSRTQRLIDLLLYVALEFNLSELNYDPDCTDGKLRTKGNDEVPCLPPPPEGLVPDLIDELGRLANIDLSQASGSSHGCFTIPSTFERSFDPNRPTSLAVRLAPDRFRISISRADVPAGKGLPNAT